MERTGLAEALQGMRVSKEFRTTCRSLNLYHSADGDLFLNPMAKKKKKMGRRVNLISWDSRLLEVLSLK